MKLLTRGLLLDAILFAALSVGATDAQSVHVYQRTLAGGVGTQVNDEVLSTGFRYSTMVAPTIPGYVFTHWSIAPDQDIDNRDRLGRARDAATYKLYGETMLTANYLPASQDSDRDGLADGYEVYWYGSTDISADSDTDGDGYTFTEEVAAGTNPLLADDATFGAVAWADGSLLNYNPESLAMYTIRCEPEGCLFETISDYAKPGTTIATPSVCGTASTFAYWTVNGQRQQDRRGRAKDAVIVVANGEPVEVVAVCIADPAERALAYWYGADSGLTAESDTDGDGFTFAEEISAGTNPLLADDATFGAVVWSDGTLLDYNPKALRSYVIRSEPEGALFETVRGTVQTGTLVTSPTLDRESGDFAYWTLNGERQCDRRGRAKDCVTFLMPNEAVELVAVCVSDKKARDVAYWYGPESGVGLDSDTDGDGYTFAEELQSGSNPQIAEESTFGVIAWSDGEMQEANLQPYEQMTGAVVDGRFAEIFHNIAADNPSQTYFGGVAIKPIVADLNGDGLFDIVVEKVGDGSRVVYLNRGSKANPEFETADWDDKWSATVELVELKSVEGLALDVQPVAALSFTMAGADLLVSDESGRIWCYQSAGEAVYTLQNKVWGGTFVGFAEGLRIAAVDWEDDGDWDCLCGTVDGKLMLLRDPKIGRPTNFRALTGVDNVLLEWDPNQQSRVKGYRVYRESIGGEKRSLVAEPNLPRHRDWPPVVQDYGYRVSALSRYYTAGNSEPTVAESVPTEPVNAELGKVTFRWGESSGFEGDAITVDLAIDNSLALSGGGLALVFAYDPAVLDPVEVKRSGLSEGIELSERRENGLWTIAANGGEVSAGGGTFVTLVFKALKVSECASVALSEARLQTVGGASVPAVLPQGGATVKILPFVEPEPISASVEMTACAQVTAGEAFTVEVAASGEGVAPETLAFEYVYDETVLDRIGDTFTAREVASAVTTVIVLTNVSVRAADGSAARVVSVGSCAVAISPKEGGGTGGGDEEEEDAGEGIVVDEEGEIVDWGEEPGADDAASRWGFRNAYIDLGTAKGKIGGDVEVSVRLRRGVLPLLVESTVDVKRWAFTVKYDPRWLTPTGVNAKIGEYSWSATNGVLTVIGQNGTVSLGRVVLTTQYPLYLKFKLNVQYAETFAELKFGAVQARSVEGKRIYTPWRTSGGVTISYARPKDDPTVVTPYGRGDLNGDGRLSWEDRQLASELMNGGSDGKWTSQQLSAGDYNGDKVLDQDDFQLLKADFKSKGITNN